MKKKIIILFVLLILTGAVLTGAVLSQGMKEMSYLSFLEEVEQGNVEKVSLSEAGDTFTLSLKSKPGNQYSVPDPGTEDFKEFLLLNDITVVSDDGSRTGKALQVILVASIGFAVIWYSRKRGRSGNLIEDANRKADPASRITLDQVAGNAEAKSMVEDIIQFIKLPEKYASVGARMPKGLLFYGPPGTGKTLMAKAIAGEANVPFYAMSGSDFVQMYVGVGANRVRSLFAKAKKSDKAVIFIDEIDAIGKRRARSVSSSNDERDQTLNALLTEMSGFNDKQGIIVIGATNRLDTLDEALLRPGRFDRQIEIGLPDVNSRRKILSLYASSKPLSDQVNLDALAKSTVYFSGAMLENLLNEAAILAANYNHKVISQNDIDRAFYTVIAGAPKQDLSYISAHDREITAYHEAGHALVTRLLLPEHYISKVTIIPSVKGAGGFNLSIPKDTLYQSRKQILSGIQVLLAGRAAEELIFGSEEITTGASNDIQKASSHIVDYINKFGMDTELGLFSTEVLEGNIDNPMIEKCRSLMNQSYEETRQLLESNLEALRKIARELLDKESLNGEDICHICA